MNPEQARSIRFKKRLEDQLDLKDKDRFDNDDDEKDTKKILRELEKQYNEEEKELGKDDYDKMEYFGYRIEPFNMKEDRETGKIHEDGFVELSRTKEKQSRDPWLDSLEEVEDPRYKPKRILTKEVEETAEPLDDKEIFHLKKELYDLLLSGESANQALKRLRPSHANAKAQTRPKKNIRKNVKTEQNSNQYNLAGDEKSNKNGSSHETHEPGQKPEEKEKVEQVKNDKKETNQEEDEKEKKFARIVEICDILVATGYMDVFSDTKEEIRKKFMKEEDILIHKDLEEEGKIEDMNPDHNVIES